jgi:hypothetical protein
MKTVKFLFALTMVSAPAFAADSYQPECASQAIAAVASSAKIPAGSLSFFNASLVGDGVDAVETIALRAEGINGLYIVSLEYDDCSVFTAPKLLNN